MTERELRAVRSAFFAIEDAADEVADAFATFGPAVRRAALALRPLAKTLAPLDERGGK